MKKRGRNTQFCTILLTVSILSSAVSYADINTDSRELLSPYEVSRLTISKSKEYSAVPYADIIVWKYKVIDGKPHRRLYNETRSAWIGNWEPI